MWDQFDVDLMKLRIIGGRFMGWKAGVSMFE